MPEFMLNKIVRDNYKDEYPRMGQEAKFVELSPEQHKELLIKKFIEEATEINPNESAEEIAGEFADLKQIFNDLMTLYEISEQQVEEIRQSKFDKKGGFINGVYVESIKLKDDDEWVPYYRKKPKVFPEKID